MKQTHRVRIFAIALLAVAVAAVAVALVVSSSDPRHPGGLLVTPSTVPAGGPRAAGPANVYVPEDLYPATLELVAKFREDNPRSKIDLHHAPGLQALAQVQDDAKATLYIDDKAVIAEMAEQSKRSLPFGDNVLQIVVAKGNPKGITSLLSFANQALTTGLCAPEIPCGAAANALFASEGIAPVPDVVSPDPNTLVADVQAGRLDAAIVYRTQARTMFLRVTGVPAAPADPTAEVAYEMAVLSGNTITAQFVQFVQNSPEAARILQRRGLKAFVRPTDTPTS